MPDNLSPPKRVALLQHVVDALALHRPWPLVANVFERLFGSGTAAMRIKDRNFTRFAEQALFGAAGWPVIGWSARGREDVGWRQPRLPRTEAPEHHPVAVQQHARREFGTARGLSPQDMFDGYYAALATPVNAAVITPTITRDPDGQGEEAPAAQFAARLAAAVTAASRATAAAKSSRVQRRRNTTP